MQSSWQDTYRALSKAVYLAAGIFLLFWFLDAALSAVLLALVVLILAIALNAPVTWLERKGVPRLAGLAIVLVASVAAAALLGWLVVPRILDEAAGLLEDAPAYLSQARRQLASLLEGYPSLQERLLQTPEVPAESVLTLVQSFVARVGRYTLSVLGVILVLLIVATAVVFAVANPKPLLRGMLGAFPADLRDQAARAFATSSTAVVGWVWSNAIIGAIEAVAAGIFLSMMGVPGAIVWAALTFFAELVPRLGAYLMSIPPILVSLAVDPMLALWVAVFYFVMQQVEGLLLGPMIRSHEMKLHAVSLIIAIVAMAAAFGFLGAILATPLVGFVKAFYDEFYGPAKESKDLDDATLEALLDRKTKDAPYSAPA